MQEGIMESDQELAIRVAGGDRLAYRDLVERYQGLLFSFGFQLTHDLDEARRLARETFVEGFFRTKPSDDAYGWITQILRIASELHREGRKVKSSSIVADRGAGEEEAKGAMSRKTMIAIADEIHTLPEPERIAVHLKHTSKMTAEQIAAVTGESPSAVSTRLSRGFKSLRDGLIQRIREGGISVGV
jgi:RNA polymerase sigma-70 factor (ECF subfamily)